jgi:hypothetical protein
MASALEILARSPMSDLIMAFLVRLARHNGITAGEDAFLCHVEKQLAFGGVEKQLAFGGDGPYR